MGVTFATASVSAAPPAVDVTFSTPAEHMELRLTGPGIEPSGKACAIPCTLELRPGTYTAYVDSNGRTSRLPVDVEDDSEVEVHPASQSRRDVGLGLFIGGSILIVAGAVAFVYDTVQIVAAIPAGYAGEGKGYRREPWVTALYIGAAVGVLPTLFGIGLLTTAGPKVVVRARGDSAHELRSARAQTARMIAAPMVVPGGAGLRLGWQF